jgi:RNA polymerase sigma-70 factor, ECF subfamily
MSAERVTKENARDGETGTLGALLDADESNARSPESEWVALVRSIAAGDEVALHALYERTHRVVFTLVMRLSHDRRTAEELMLDVFHDIWRRAASYDAADGTVVGWIMNQARSRAIDRLRYEQRKKRIDPHPGDALGTTPDADCEAALEAGEQAERLREALARLGSDERLAIETVFFSELTYAEAAERLQQPPGTLKSRVRSGLAKLRQGLAKGAKIR